MMALAKAKLMRTSSGALTRANAVPANVFYIMQGGGERKASQFFIAALNRLLTEGAGISVFIGADQAGWRSG